MFDYLAFPNTRNHVVFVLERLLCIIQNTKTPVFKSSMQINKINDKTSFACLNMWLHYNIIKQTIVYT